MNNEAVKSLLNPVRIRIIQELGGKEKATTKELASILNDIPQASLYRHIANLVKNKLVTVVEEHQVRGITEKVYSISPNLNRALNIDPKTITKKDLSELFTRFVIELLTDFDGSMSGVEKFDPNDTRVIFQSASMYLSQTELIDMLTQIGGVMQKFLANPMTEGRSLRKFSTIITTAQTQDEKTEK